MKEKDIECDEKLRRLLETIEMYHETLSTKKQNKKTADELANEIEKKFLESEHNKAYVFMRNKFYREKEEFCDVSELVDLNEQNYDKAKQCKYRRISRPNETYSCIKPKIGGDAKKTMCTLGESSKLKMNIFKKSENLKNEQTLRLVKIKSSKTSTNFEPVSIEKNELNVRNNPEKRKELFETPSNSGAKILNYCNRMDRKSVFNPFISTKTEWNEVKAKEEKENENIIKNENKERHFSQSISKKFSESYSKSNSKNSFSRKHKEIHSARLLQTEKRIYFKKNVEFEATKPFIAKKEFHF